MKHLDVLKFLKQSGSHIFSLLHGTEGEDGAWQGVADVLDLPGNFGAVDIASLAMNKVAFAATAVSVVPSLTTPVTYVVQTEDPDRDIKDACRALSGRPCVIKPNSLGASLLTDYLHRPEPAVIRSLVSKIAPHDRLALLQEYVTGQEITVGIVQDETGVQVLPIARARTNGPLLGHYEKHTSDAGVFVDWLDVESKIAQTLTEVSLRLVRLLGFRLWARFDFIVSVEEAPKIYVLEANLMPGLGPGSIFPVMLARAGLNLEDLVVASAQLKSGRPPATKVLEYAIEPHHIREV
jgi:D-alanine-D-alanine ligase